MVNLIEVVTSARANGKSADNGSIYLVFEYFEMDLAGLSSWTELHAEEIRCYTRQLLSALAYLHENDVCHRDIKCSNILISGRHQLKVTDFGLARRMGLRGVEGQASVPRTYTNRVVTLWYRAPELLLGSEHYDMGVDMWSVGCIIAELIMGTALLQGKAELDQLRKIFELCGTPMRESHWKDIGTLPNQMWLCELKDFNSTIVKDAIKGSKRMAIKEPPGRLAEYLQKKCPKDAFDLIRHLLALDPSTRRSTSLTGGNER
ncbi:Protein kinase, putative [Hondaea fermentalgiana]|uniref:Cyclin-dependent kinase 2 homolog n=1 Tax=Hondaea fermentalgiana TaxID=2315210 RepID=A0A2R5G0D4_9STRA|nr:Protein kinase, putative [Hondaea fermentalgiana]|eukprot:GBG24472.1 Protein kinase, putative [Hondaea fermentalgiana]